MKGGFFNVLVGSADGCWPFALLDVVDGSTDAGASLGGCFSEAKIAGNFIGISIFSPYVRVFVAQMKGKRSTDASLFASATK